MEKVAAKANENEQFSRRQNVRVMGFVEEEEENCAERFMNIYIIILFIYINFAMDHSLYCSKNCFVK